MGARVDYERTAETLMTYMQRCEYSQDDVLFRPGDTSDDLYIVEQGTVRIQVLTTLVWNIWPSHSSLPFRMLPSILNSISARHLLSRLAELPGSVIHYCILQVHRPAGLACGLHAFVWGCVCVGTLVGKR